MAWMPTGWEVLGQRILAVRSRRWRTRAEFATATGLSTRTLDDLENGIRQRYHTSTLAAVETALGWEPGSCERIVAGGKEKPEMDPNLLRFLDAWWHLSPETQSLFAEIAERAPRELRKPDGTPER